MARPDSTRFSAREALNEHARLCRNSHSFLLNGFKSFNSLFKVLFTFPSQYLFAIGFPSIFSLRRSVSPHLDSNPKLSDSSSASFESSPGEHGSVTLFAGQFQKPWPGPFSADCGLQLTTPWPQAKDSQLGLFPVRSPLLRESLLTSFPPLTDMLKFSGFSGSYFRLLVSRKTDFSGLGR